jgi:hypothetical protein
MYLTYELRPTQAHKLTMLADLNSWNKRNITGGQHDDSGNEERDFDHTERPPRVIPFSVKQFFM